MGLEHISRMFTGFDGKLLICCAVYMYVLGECKIRRLLGMFILERKQSEPKEYKRGAYTSGGKYDGTAAVVLAFMPVSSSVPIIKGTDSIATIIFTTSSTHYTVKTFLIN